MYPSPHSLTFGGGNALNVVNHHKSRRGKWGNSERTVKQRRNEERRNEERSHGWSRG